MSVEGKVPRGSRLRGNGGGDKGNPDDEGLQAIGT